MRHLNQYWYSPSSIDVISLEFSIPTTHIGIGASPSFSLLRVWGTRSHWHALRLEHHHDFNYPTTFPKEGLYRLCYDRFTVYHWAKYLMGRSCWQLLVCGCGFHCGFYFYIAALTIALCILHFTPNVHCQDTLEQECLCEWDIPIAWWNASTINLLESSYSKSKS